MTGQYAGAGRASTCRAAPGRVDFTAPVAPGWSLTVSRRRHAVAGHGGAQRRRHAADVHAVGAAPGRGRRHRRPSPGVISADGAALATQTWTFRTRRPETVRPQTLFGDVVPRTESPPTTAAPVELGIGLHAQPQTAGHGDPLLQGRRQHGTHTGSLWSATGTRLADRHLRDETATGWQTAMLATPVAVTGRQAYVVVLLRAPGPLRATRRLLRQPVDHRRPDGPGGRQRPLPLRRGGGFPAYSWDATNYFVDVVFERAPPAIAVAGADARRRCRPGDGHDATRRSPSPRRSRTGWSMTLERRRHGRGRHGGAVRRRRDAHLHARPRRCAADTTTR